MAGIEARIGQAAASHRRAAALAGAAGAVLEGYAPARSSTTERGVRELAERLRVAGAQLAPGWLGAPLDAVPASTPLGVARRPELVRIGAAYPLDDASFPVVVPLGHLAIDGDARDPRVAAVLRAVLLRLLATVRPGSLVVRPVDAAGVAFAPFAPLADAGIMPPPVTDRAGLCAVLTEAEQWVADRPDAALLLVVATWPEETEPTELARFSALAAAGPDAGVRLLLAGWPPPLLGEEATEPLVLTSERPGPPLPHATPVALRNPYVLVGHPAGGSFGSAVPTGAAPPPGLNARVFLDESPPVELINRVCRDVAGAALAQARESLRDLVPDGPLWTESAAGGLAVVVGRAGDTPVVVRLADPTPHWLVVGEAGSGKTALLLGVLYGLCGRYSPQQLHCYLLDFTGGRSVAEFAPRPGERAFLPHTRAVGVGGGQSDATALLHGLATELARRRQEPSPTWPRALCVVDGLDRLLAGDDPAAEAALESLLRDGGGQGIHLILAGETVPPDRLSGRCRVRIALPGGAGALDSANQAAAGLALGTAVVNTAAGLGGPAGATRAHEKLVRFPDPRREPVALAGLRHRLWRVDGGGDS